MHSTLTEQLTANFYLWEQRGRGWQVWDEPVTLEPSFVPFFHSLQSQTPVDDGRKETFLSALFDGWRKALGNAPPHVGSPPLPESLEEPLPALFDCPFDIKELRLLLPSDQKVSTKYAEQFLLTLSSCAWLLSFEVVGTAEGIIVQCACREPDISYVTQQVRAHFPDVVVQGGSILAGTLKREDAVAVVIDLGLDQEFMRPLRTFSSLDPDPLAGLYGVLDDLRPGEVGMLQVLFQTAQQPWVPSIMRAVTDYEGKSFFADAPEMVTLAQEKISRPLFAVVVRIVAQSGNQARSADVARNLIGSLGTLSSPDRNAFIPLANDGYDDATHLHDALLRQTHRSGMLLNSEELSALIHLPSAAIRSPKLRGEYRKTKAAPLIAAGHDFIIGENVHQGIATQVSLSREQRLRHIHVIGATGTGKSTLLLRMILQDVEQGSGCAVLDPHGDLIDRILERVPERRFEDVVLFDPADTEYPVGFNILQARSEVEKNVLASDLVAIFRRFATSWGDQMTTVLGNAVSAFLESDRVGTLIDLKRFLIEKEYRQVLLRDVHDPTITYFWEKEFPLLRGAPLSSILTRLDIFLRPRLIRNIVGQTQGLDCEEIINGKKILLAKLAQGLIGEENAYLLGSLLIAKLHQVVMGRQTRDLAEREPFFLYLDEFQHFITPSMAAILGGARKFSLGLILAHQDLRQLWDEDTRLANSVITNPDIRICFRLGDFDAEKLKDGFAHFDASDLQNLSVGEAIARIERKEYDFNLRTLVPPTVTPEVARARNEDIVSLSRRKYGHRVAEPVEVTLKEEKPDVAEPSPEAQMPRERKVEVIPPEAGIPTAPPVSPKEYDVSRHRYLQTLIKKMAEQRGYRAVIEEPTPDGTGRVDVGLERNGKRLACEISVTTRDVQELHNIEKCLRAGYDSVIVCSPEKKNLDAIRKMIEEKLSPADQSKVLLFEPEELFLFLDEQAPKEVGREERVKGYRVKVQYQAISDADRKKKREELARVIAGSLRRIKGKT
jgi:hypothetical protein